MKDETGSATTPAVSEGVGPSPPPSVAPTLEYGRADTQYGVVFEHRADGGVVITVPGTRFRYLRRRLAGASNGSEALLTALLFAGGKLFGKPTPPRAVIRLTWWGLRIREPDGGVAEAERTRSWRLREVGEIRPNRYSKGLYVRIPGTDNFDLLKDLPKELVERIGRTLEEALARLRKTAAEGDAVRHDRDAADEE